MKRFLLILTTLALLLTALPASASEQFPMTGEPLPDFSFTDTEGAEVTLSELLKDNELVVICMFASWCGPCKREFPFMQEVCNEYSDQMELLALTAEPKDTMETMTKFKADYDLNFHFGLARDTNIMDTVPVDAYPIIIFVDRFGNMPFIRSGSFPGRSAFERTVKTFLGDGYTETVTLDDIPPLEMDVPYPDEAELAAALTGEGIELICEVDKNEDIFPFVPKTIGDRTAVCASNAGVESSYAHLMVAFSSEEGDALYFEVGNDMPSNAPSLGFYLDGEPVKYFADKRDWTPFAMPLTPGEHIADFVYNTVMQDENVKYIGVDNMSLYSGDKAGEALALMKEYPHAEETSYTLLNADARRVVLSLDGEPQDNVVYSSEEDTVRLAIRVAEDIDPETSVVMDDITNEETFISNLPVEDDAFIYECPNGGTTIIYVIGNYYGEYYQYEELAVCHGETALESLIEMNRNNGIEGVTWSYADDLSEEAQPAEDKEVLVSDPEVTYTVTVVDQNGDPVPEVSLTFCLDDACRLAEGDENGVVVFEGKPAEYHVQVVDAPEEYSYPDESDVYTEARASELTITITKD